MKINLLKIRKATGLLGLLFLYAHLALGQNGALRTGADQVERWLPLLQGKKVGLVVNHTAMVGNRHLLDVLLANKIQVDVIFAPEHGFRGEAEAGAIIQNGKDSKTGLPVVSLYGNKKKPSAADLRQTEVVVFDIQDVGARFYTYISTLHYVMEACAEFGIPLILFDRPNPNGHYVDGPVLDINYKSFVGMHPIPVVHGMTIGEYACMINGEGWLANGAKCSLEIVPLIGYDHQTIYELPVAPSPNLPNMRAIYLYPSLCFFEGTAVSLGRGTEAPFQQIGAPWFKGGTAAFTPQPIKGKSENPPLKGEKCFGYDYTKQDALDFRQLKQLDLQALIDFYEQSPDKNKFFIPFFDKLAGGTMLREQIESKMTAQQIRDSWADGLKEFRVIRAKYLLYPDDNRD